MSTLNKIIYSFILTASCLYFSSCSEDNFDVVDSEVVISQPDTLEAVEVTGRIMDRNGGVIANAQVQALINGEVLNISADAAGQYSIPDVPESHGKIHLVAEAEGFVATDQLLTVDDSPVQHDVMLLEEGSNAYGAAGQPSLAGTVYSLSGRLLKADGSPAGLREIYVLNLFASNTDNWQYTFTDADGNWSIITESLDGFQVIAVDNCSNVIFIDEDVDVVDQDVDLGDFTSDITDLTEFSEIRFSGTVTECTTGDPISRGSVRVVFENSQGAWDAEVRDGQYDFVARNCEAAACYTITVASFAGGEPVTSSCQSISTDDIVENFSICEDPQVEENDGNLSILIDGQTLDFSLVHIEEDATISDLWLLSAISFDTDQLGLLQFQDLVDGQALLFGIASFDGMAEYLTTENDTVNVVIDSTTTTAAYGSFSGTVTAGATGAQTTVSATFKAIFK